MGLKSYLSGGDNDGRNEDDYRDASEANVEASATGAGPQIRTAEVTNENDLIPVKDAIYEGDIILIDLSPSPGTRRWERIEDEILKVADEVGGDVALNGDDLCIVSPPGIGISKEKL